MKRFVLVMLGLFVISSVLACSTTNTASVAGGRDKPDDKNPLVGHWLGDNVYVYTNKTWKLEITYLNMGTRSEGQDGKLFENGKPVEADKKGVSRVTPLGLLKYYGRERKRLWDLSGWNFADRRKVRRSADLPKETPAEKEPATKP